MLPNGTTKLLLNRREWKRLKGCVFSPPSLCPVPGRGREARKRNPSIASIPAPVLCVKDGYQKQNKSGYRSMNPLLWTTMQIHTQRGKTNEERHLSLGSLLARPSRTPWGSTGCKCTTQRHRGSKKAGQIYLLEVASIVLKSKNPKKMNRTTL